MATTKEDLQRAQCFGPGCMRNWSCNALPSETPAVVVCCYPCAVGMQWETMRSLNYNPKNILCPSSFEGCACCALSLCLSPGMDIMVQGYISTDLASDTREVTGGDCVKYTCWNCFSPCTCGPCITMEVAYNARNNAASTKDNMKTLM